MKKFRIGDKVQLWDDKLSRPPGVTVDDVLVIVSMRDEVQGQSRTRIAVCRPDGLTAEQAGVGARDVEIPVEHLAYVPDRKRKLVGDVVEFTGADPGVMASRVGGYAHYGLRESDVFTVERATTYGPPSSARRALVCSCKRLSGREFLLWDSDLRRVLPNNETVTAA